jgi:two-component sensor histidine kinase
MVSDPELELSVRPAPGAASVARRALEGCRLVESEQEPTLLLLVSELVSNCVRHAGLRPDEPIALRARLGEEDVAALDLAAEGGDLLLVLGRAHEALAPLVGDLFQELGRSTSYVVLKPRPDEAHPNLL